MAQAGRREIYFRMIVATRKLIATVDRLGEPNGAVLPIYNLLEPEFEHVRAPDQVYAVIIRPGMCKGPHLHLKRSGLFCCLVGDARIIIRRDGRYQEFLTGIRYDHAVVQVNPGEPCLLQNFGKSLAVLLNMPAPPYTKADPDEHPVEFDDYKMKWFVNPEEEQVTV